MTADDIITAARACIDTPFMHQGRLPGLALDCAGLVIVVAKAIGAEYTDVVGYSRSPSGGMLESCLCSQPSLDIITGADKQAGDILLIRFAGDPQHLAIFTGDTIIHSYASVGKVCEHVMDAAWEKRVVCAYRFKGLT